MCIYPTHSVTVASQLRYEETKQLERDSDTHNLWWTEISPNNAGLRRKNN